MVLIIATFSMFATATSAEIDTEVGAIPITPGNLISTTQIYTEFELTSHESGQTYIFLWMYQIIA